MQLGGRSDRRLFATSFMTVASLTGLFLFPLEVLGGHTVSYYLCYVSVLLKCPPIKR